MGERIEMLPPNHPYCKRVLYKGLQGEDVKWLQEMLDMLNSYYKFCPNRNSLHISGYFGDETARFLKFFQYKADLIPDSHFDKATCEKLIRQYQNYIIEMSILADEAITKQKEKILFDRYN